MTAKQLTRLTHIRLLSSYGRLVRISTVYLQNVLSTYEPRHEISNNVICATSKASDQPAHMRSLIRAFTCRLIIL